MRMLAPKSQPCSGRHRFAAHLQEPRRESRLRCEWDGRGCRRGVHLVGIGSVHPELAAASASPALRNLPRRPHLPGCGRRRGVADPRLRGRGRVPTAQVCCGQPAFNAGHRTAARRVARTFARAFSQEHAGRRSGRLLRRDDRAPPTGTARLRAVRGVRALRVPGARRPPLFHASTNLSTSATTRRATCCESSTSTGRRNAYSSGPARASSHLGGPISAVASAARSPSASPRCRLRWRTTSSRPQSGTAALVTADPGCLMHLASPLGARSGHSHRSSRDRPRARRESDGVTRPRSAAPNDFRAGGDGDARARGRAANDRQRHGASREAPA